MDGQVNVDCINASLKVIPTRMLVISLTKCVILDSFDTGGDIRILQLGTIIECRISNTDHVVREGHLRQAAAIFERSLTYTGNAVRDGHARLFYRATQQHTHIICIQYAILGSIRIIVFGHCDGLNGFIPQQFTVIQVVNTCTLAYCHTRQIIAIFERVLTYTGHAVGDRHALQSVATIERPYAYTGHAVWDRHARQAVAFFERTLTYTGHAVRDRHARQASASRETSFTYIGHAVRDRHALQSVTDVKRTVTYNSHTVRDRHVRQTGAPRERTLAYTGHAVRDRHALLCTGAT